MSEDLYEDYHDPYYEAMTPEEREAFDAFQEEQLAIAEGRATELTRCYMCWIDEQPAGAIPPGETLSVGPLRGIVGSFTSPGPDPYHVMVLAPCGHEII